MENFKNRKLNLILRLWFFNTFTFGFVLNFISYLNSNWLRNNVYTYGLFEYCEIALTNDKNYTFPKQSFSCKFWSNNSKPKFIKYSVGMLTMALAIHFLSIIIFFAILFIFEKYIEKYRKKFNFFNLILTVLILCLYGANILTFSYQSVSTENDQSLSFCFWFSLIGFLATLLSISFFLVNFNKNNSENKNRNQDYQSIIMSHISKRQPFDEIVNVNMTHSESEQTLTKSITVRNLTQFKFKQLYEFLFGKIRTFVSNKACLKSNQGSVKSCDDSNATTIYTNSSKIQICPLHSLVLPTMKKSSGFQHTKMMVLPFGRLSGVHNKIQPNNCNE